MERSEKQKRGREVFLSGVFSRAWPWHSVQAPTSWVRDNVIDPPSPIHPSLAPALWQPLYWQPRHQSCLSLVPAYEAPCLVGRQETDRYNVREDCWGGWSQGGLPGGGGVYAQGRRLRSRSLPDEAGVGGDVS